MNRADLKAHVRQCMRDARPSPVWVTLVYMLPVLGFMWIIWGMLAVPIGYSLLQEAVGNYGFVMHPNFFTILGLVFAFSLLYSLISVGYTGYCLRVSRGEDASFGNLFDYINQPMRFIGLSLLITLATAPISLLGNYFGTLGSIVSLAVIYIEYGFAQAIFVAIDRPELGIVGCMRESWSLMHGRRWEYFVLQLSFILWILACVFIIPVFYVNPYIATVNAGYYNIISDWQPVEQAHEGF